MALANALMMYEFNDSEVAAILRNYPHGKRLEAELSYLELTISKAREQWKKNQGKEPVKSISAQLPWKIIDIAEMETIKVEPRICIVDPFIAKREITYLIGPPKTAKSLMTVDILVNMLRGRQWLDRFPTKKTKTLYIAREDPTRRIRDRVLEINRSYGQEAMEPGLIGFVVQEPFSLLDDKHIDELYQVIDAHNYEFLILDVLSMLIPGKDVNSSKDMSEVNVILERIKREKSVALLVVDHTRKLASNYKGKKETVDQDDQLGSVTKIGFGENFMGICKTKIHNQISVRTWGKDHSEQNFRVNVSEIGNQSFPKFLYAADEEILRQVKVEEGNRNRETVLSLLSENWTPAKTIEQNTELSKSTVLKYLKELTEEGLAEKKGTNPDVTYRKKQPSATQSFLSGR
jgi:hypothetical protein